MKTVCIVQARLGSKRLPGKVLLPLNGHTVIGEVLSRCKQIQGIDEVICAIPEADEKLARVARKYCQVFYGSELNVLDRYYRAAKSFGADIIMRITGDCPLISPELCSIVLETFRQRGVDYASNVHPRTFPQGYDCEVFTFALLEKIMDVGDDLDREHVTPRMAMIDNKVNIESPWKLDGRLTLDTEDDYRVICKAFGHEPYQHRIAA